MRVLWSIFLWSLANSGYTFSWPELWVTKDQQAQMLMQQKQFDKAEKTFQQGDWRATAAYRAGHYEEAAKDFQSLQNEQGYYNQGNALAHLGQYGEAIKAYEKALALNPHNQDAIYNRNLLQELLKKEKQQQQGNNQQGKNQQGNGQQGKDQQGKDQQGKDQQGKDQQGNGQQGNGQQGKDQQGNGQQGKDQQSKDQESKTQQSEKEMGQGATTKEQAALEHEKQQAKEQWLRLIPDDPGGLMREKFLRDHMRRQSGWYE